MLRHLQKACMAHTHEPDTHALLAPGLEAQAAVFVATTQQWLGRASMSES